MNKEECEVPEQSGEPDRTHTQDPPLDDEPADPKGGADGKTKALGTPGLGDRGRTNVDDFTD